MKETVLWKPNSGPQTEVLRISPSQAFEVGFGGARGGGKTDAGMAWLLYDREVPNLRARVIRRNADDLTDWVDRAERFFAPFGAIKRGNPGDFHFPSGYTILTGHLKDKNAYSKYVGHEYQRMLIEELNLIPALENYKRLISSCRSTIPHVLPQVMSNFNPSDEGFYWIRDYFRIPDWPTGAVYTKDPTTGLTRVFVPSKLEDNPYLMGDNNYRAFLDGLPDGLRDAWRHGFWGDPIIKGAFYTKEIDQARTEGRIKQVPYDPALKVHTVWDLGMDDSMSIGFWQRTKTDIRFIDYYENNSYGIDHYFQMLQERQRDRRYVYGRHFVPHDANKRELGTGKTIIDVAYDMGWELTQVPMIPFTDGILRVRLMFPRLFANEPETKQALNAWRTYRREWDEQLLKYKDSPIHDWSSHAADMLRYAATVEQDMTNDDVRPYEPPPRPRESVYEGQAGDENRHPMLRGVDIGRM